MHTHARARATLPDGGARSSGGLDPVGAVVFLPSDCSQIFADWTETLGERERKRKFHFCDLPGIPYRFHFFPAIPLQVPTKSTTANNYLAASKVAGD
jgi:hypothetical protein